MLEICTPSGKWFFMFKTLQNWTRSDKFQNLNAKTDNEKKINQLSQTDVMTNNNKHLT